MWLRPGFAELQGGGCLFPEECEQLASDSEKKHCRMVSKKEPGEPHQTAIMKGNQPKKNEGLEPPGMYREDLLSYRDQKDSGMPSEMTGGTQRSLESHFSLKTPTNLSGFFFLGSLLKEGDKEALSSGSAIPSLLEGAGGLMQPGIPPFQFSPQTQRQKNARNFPAPSPDLLPSPFPPLATSSSGGEGGILITK